MARTTAGQYQFDVATYMSGTLGMTEYPSFYGEGSQLLVPGDEYFALMVNQVQIIRDQDAAEDLVELLIQLRLLYRFILNEDEYTNDSTTPSKQKAALALLADELAGRQVVDLLAVDGRVKGEVERLQRLGRVDLAAAQA